MWMCRCGVEKDAVEASRDQGEDAAVISCLQDFRCGQLHDNTGVASAHIRLLAQALTAGWEGLSSNQVAPAGWPTCLVANVPAPHCSPGMSCGRRTAQQGCGAALSAHRRTYVLMRAWATRAMRTARTCAPRWLPALRVSSDACSPSEAHGLSSRACVARLCLGINAVCEGLHNLCFSLALALHESSTADAAARTSLSGGFFLVDKIIMLWQIFKAVVKSSFEAQDASSHADMPHLSAHCVSCGRRRVL